MFRKLVSNLPFSPSLINQIGFYTTRLKKEQLTRKLGLFVTLLALTIQTLTLIVPAQATLAASDNDIIYNGNGKTKAGIIEAYFNNRDQLGRTDIRAIFQTYKITALELNEAKVVTIRSTRANNYWSIGRSPRGYGGEVTVQVPNGPLLYSRTLHGWAENRDWKALEVNTASGIRWILLECGNIVTKQPSSGAVIKPVDKPIAEKDDQPSFNLELHKTARNISQQISNANGTTALPGDTVEYTLSVTNRSPQVRRGFVIEENVSDILEYANITDASGANFSTTPIKMLSWTAVDIKPNETIKRTVLIQIKSPLPTTPVATSDPSSYDMKLVNRYGADTVQIYLPRNSIKTVEYTVNTLPSTGLGTNIAMSTLLVMVVTYFYFRSRTSVKELVLIRQQFNHGLGV